MFARSSLWFAGALVALSLSSIPGCAADSGGPVESAPVSTDPAAAGDQAQADESAAALRACSVSAISGYAALGLREDLRAAQGQLPTGPFDTTDAVVVGAIRVRHNYSQEIVEFKTTSWEFPSSGGDSTFRTPNLFDNIEPGANLAAKKVFLAMTKASEKIDPPANPAGYVLTTRTSPKGLVVCTHVTSWVLDGTRIPEQYDCEFKGINRVGQARNFR